MPVILNTDRTGIVIGMVELKTDASLDAMRAAGRVVAQALAAVREAAAWGSHCLELDETARAGAARGGRGLALPRLPAPTSRPSPSPPSSAPRSTTRSCTASRTPTGCATATWCPSTAAPNSAAGPATRPSASRSAVRAPTDLRLIETAERGAGRGHRRGRRRQPHRRHRARDRQVCRSAGYGIPDGFGGHGMGRTHARGPGRPQRGPPGPRPAAARTAWSSPSSPC